MEIAIDIFFMAILGGAVFLLFLIILYRMVKRRKKSKSG